MESGIIPTKTVLYTLSLAIVGLGSTTAGAAELEEPGAWEVSLQAGPAFEHDKLLGSPNDNRLPYRLEFEADWAWAFSVRRRFGPRISLGLRGTRSRRGLDSASPTGSVAGGSETRTAGYLDLVIALRPNNRLRPYGRFGVGLLEVSYDNIVVNQTPVVDDSDRVFGYAAGLGIAYALNEQWSVEAEFLYQDGRDVYFKDPAGDALRNNSWNCQLTLGFGYRF